MPRTRTKLGLRDGGLPIPLDSGGGASPLLTNLTAYWSMDEASGTRADSTGNGYDLTDNNTVPSGTGLINNAADFTAANSEYLNVNSVPAQGLQLTVAGWLNLDVKTTAYFVDYATGTTNDETVIRLLYIGGATDEMRLITGSGASATTISVSFSTLSTGSFVFVVAQVNGTNTKLRINDSDSLQAISGAATTQSAIADFYVGARATSPAAYLTGLVDELGLWSRVLTASEITQLYNGGSGLAYPFS